MSFRPNALAAYGSIANTESNPIQQIVMLYDGAIKFFRLAAADIEAQDVSAKAEHSNRALDIIIYLQSILDFERGGDVAPALDTLYLNVMAMALKASATLDSETMRQAAELLIPVRDAWVETFARLATQESHSAPQAFVPDM
ncbi:MAG TPA: flagellar export chaperone FliS, partial [Blastocatellia bacterium]|nr:flagellar export chaperone FliS [Blastocatellia bacterium]